MQIDLYHRATNRTRDSGVTANLAQNGGVTY